MWLFLPPLPGSGSCRGHRLHQRAKPVGKSVLIEPGLSVARMLSIKEDQEVLLREASVRTCPSAIPRLPFSFWLPGSSVSFFFTNFSSSTALLNLGVFQMSLFLWVISNVQTFAHNQYPFPLIIALSLPPSLLKLMDFYWIPSIFFWALG